MSKAHSQPYFIKPPQLHPDHPLFVFLPGMDESTKLALMQVASVATAFDVCSFVIEPDVMDGWDILCDKVIALTTEALLTLPRKSVYLCGESFGGCLALKVMMKAPRLFERIILVNPASSFNRRPWIHWGSLLTRWLPERLYQMTSVLFLPFLASVRRMTPDARQTLLESVRSVPLKTSIQRLSLMREFNVEEKQLNQFTKPVLIIASKGDRLLPSVTEGKRLARIFPNARFFTLPHSGHACLLEADVNLYEIMRSENFLDNL